MVKVSLVRPEIDREYAELHSGYTIIPPPSGLEMLASYVCSRMNEVEVKVYSDIMGLKDRELTNDFLGLSDWFSNHQTAMDISRKTKQRNPNCKVVVGGPNGSNLGARILRNHSYIDYVVCGDGEEALVGIIEAEKGKRQLGEVPNLWYRSENSEVVYTFDKNVSLNEIPLFDFSHVTNLQLEPYNSKRDDFSSDIDRTPIPISSIRGCIKATKLGKCSYCHIPMKGVRLMKPEKVWEQIRLLHDKYGITEFFETGDDFIVGNYPKRLLEAKPAGLDVSFRIYTAPDKVGPDIASTMRQLGVREIFMGIENINPEILTRANKFYDVSKVEDSVRNCENEGIKVFLPFLFGLPGETDETAKRNHEFAHRIAKKYKNVNRILYSLAVPIVGCSWFNELASDKEIQQQYPEILWQDNLDYPKLTELSLRRLCNVNIDALLQIVNSPPDLPSQRVANYGDIAHKIMERKK
jgi:radical SAM superfamily enzyme YgiQ (UPF0313 family)